MYVNNIQGVCYNTKYQYNTNSGENSIQFLNQEKRNLGKLFGIEKF